MGWMTLETETERPPIRIFARSDIDRLATNRKRSERVPRRELTPAMTRQVAAAYANGATIADVGETLRVSRREVYRCLSQHGIPIRRGGHG